MTECDTKEAFYDFIRPEIRKLAMQMELKFRLHDKERGNPFRVFQDWETFLYDRHAEEETEFYRAMGRFGDARKPPSDVWKEAADCANIRLMEAYNYERMWMAGVEARERRIEGR